MESNNTNEISLKELILGIKQYVRYLAKKWWIIAGFSLIGLFAGYLYAKKSVTYYEGISTFVLESGNASMGSSMSGVASMLGLNMGGREGAESLFQGESLFELYKSRFVLEKVLMKRIDSSRAELLVQRFCATNEDLKEVLEEQPSLKALIEKPDFFLSPSPTELRKRDSILTGIGNTIKDQFLDIQKVNTKANIIEVKVRSEDEEFAKVFNEKLVEDVNEYYLNVKLGRSKENVDLLQHKVDSVTAVLNRAVSSGGSIQDATPNLNPVRQSQRVIPLQKSQISADMNKAILEELMRNLELSKISLAKDAPLIKVVDGTRYPLAKVAPNVKLLSIAGALVFFFLVVGFLVFRKVLGSIMNS